ncbi:uncharacterized protein LOC136091968 [Hydra vulgaris]|uniref:Uncharacterized protein LOC136091968 n=1 Tax=Hydra vulgaris TaxID=6087 RepID=A0ABM4DMJ8_HYDVU
MNGNSIEIKHQIVVNLSINDTTIDLECLVADIVPEYQMLLGMDAIRLLGGVQVGRDGETINFNVEQLTIGATAVSQEKTSEVSSSTILKLIDKDFVAEFKNGSWSVSWKWLMEPPTLTNKIPNYHISEDVKSEYAMEISEWIAQGWLKPFEGRCNGIIPLMAVTQRNKLKIRPVMDYRELNQFVSSHTADGDVCSTKLRNWRKLGENLEIIDLKKAYLQIRVDEALWKYQVVEYEGQRYCLTRLGFGLNVAPRIMTKILKKVLSLDKFVESGTDSFIDDIIVNNNIVSSCRVQELLKKYGLDSKLPEKLVGGRVLGLRVYKQCNQVRWKRDNIPKVPEGKMTRRQIFSWCGQLTGHFPIANWLRPSCSYLKRVSSSCGWDSLVNERVVKLVSSLNERLTKEDPVHGSWNVKNISEATVWCDASSLAVGIVLEVAGEIVEDCSWLRKQDDTAHINLAELEAVIKGINLATKWGFECINIKCDSATVVGWLRSLIIGDKPVRVHGLGEPLVRRRLSLIEDLVKECNIKLKLFLVKSAENKADALTRVPQNWLHANHSAMTANVVPPDVKSFHNLHHFGVNRTLYLMKQTYPKEKVCRKDVESVVKSCERCLSVDPAPIRWEEGNLEVGKSWHRLAIDITHYKSEIYLSIIDCGKRSKFAIWRRLQNEKETTVCFHLEEIFRERGPPWQVLLDNSKTFRSKLVGELCADWGVSILFRCAYRPSGNGIVERHHRTIKRMAARSGKDPLKMVYWYNIAPRKNGEETSLPYKAIFSYEWKPHTISAKTNAEVLHNYTQGQEVFVKPPDSKCTSEWNRGRVSDEGRGVSVEINGLPRHMSDVRPAPIVADLSIRESEEPIADNLNLRRSTRVRRFPNKYADFVI